MSFKRTSMPDFSGRLHFWDSVKQGAATLLCVFALSSCGPISSPFSKDNPAADSSGTAAPQGDSGPKVVEPLTPPGAGNRPLAPGQSGAEYLPNGLPALQPLGVNVDTMFSERIKDEDKRFERVENAVKDMRREFDAVKPSILRLVAVEQDMQDLMAQLETLLRTEPPPPSPAPVAAVMEPMALAPPSDGKAPAARATPLPPAPTAQSPPLLPAPAEAEEYPPPEPSPSAATPPKSGNASGGDAVSAADGITVRDLRIGEHGDKTRLVFDVTGPAPYRYDIDNGEKIMIVELPGAGWAGKPQWTSAKAPLLASYTASPSDGGGSRVIIQLKQAASVVYETTIAGGAGAPYRIVIDLKGQ